MMLNVRLTLALLHLPRARIWRPLISRPIPPPKTVLPIYALNRQRLTLFNSARDFGLLGSLGLMGDFPLTIG